jgi:SAM-dependent methyltransferase
LWAGDREPAGRFGRRQYGANMGDHAAPLIDVGGFDKVDSSSAPDDYARWMAHQRRHGADGSIDRLELHPGSRVLDLGCGTGIDLQAMTRLAGSCIGVDRSFAMTRSAQETVDGGAGLACSDGAALPFAANTFDACWSRAVLLHTPRPESVVAEVARVVRSDGRIVFGEPDHGTHIVNTSELDIFDRILRHRRSTFRNPLIGRRLPELVVAAGLRIETVKATPIVHTSLATARASGGPFDVAVESAIAAGAVTTGEARRYLDSIEALDINGAFVFSAMAITVVARVEPA